MPLPDYGHHNAEKKTHQDMVTNYCLIETKNKEHYISSEKAQKDCKWCNIQGVWDDVINDAMFKVFEMAPEIVSDDDSMEVFIVITNAKPKENGL